MKNFILWVLFTILAVLLAGCTAQPAVVQTLGPAAPAGGTLIVFAAASLKAPFEVLVAQFEGEHPGWEVVLNLAGSQQLAQQINSGAPADVFASANQAQLDAVIAGGRAAEGGGQVFARNRLVIVTPAENPAGLQTPADLATGGIKLVLASGEVPAGSYSLEFLGKAAADPAFGADFQARVLGNVVSYEDNVKAVLSKVVLGEADAGIVYASDAAGPDGEKIIQIVIPDELNSTAEYPAVVLSDSPSADMAQAFVDFLLSEAGQAALAQAGLIPVGE